MRQRGDQPKNPSTTTQTIQNLIRSNDKWKLQTHIHYLRQHINDSIPSSSTFDGGTYLHLAVSKSSSLEIITFLIQDCQADVLAIATKTKKTPLETIDTKHTAILNYLIQATEERRQRDLCSLSNLPTRTSMDVVLDVLLLLVTGAHIILSPYTKVEESFNVQATHDMLFHGTNLDVYDHHVFPGVVPRTFVGALAVSVIASPGIQFLRLCSRFVTLDTGGFMSSQDRVYALLIVRLILAAATCHALSKMRRELSKQFGSICGIIFAMVSCLQFHLPFYAGRPLPNIFALVLVIHAWQHLIRGISSIDGIVPSSKTLFLSFLTPGTRNNVMSAVQYLVTAAVLFRCDIVVLLVPILMLDGMRWIWNRRLGTWICNTLLVGAVAGFAALTCTICIDSWFWKRWIWPEFEVFWFNVIDNKSSDWGTESWHWYWTSALPRSCLFALPLAFVGCFLWSSNSSGVGGTDGTDGNGVETDVSFFKQEKNKIHGGNKYKIQVQRAQYVSQMVLRSTTTEPMVTVIDRASISIFRLLLPCICFVCLYSILPHKELRFVLYVVPAINACCAICLTSLYARWIRKKNKSRVAGLSFGIGILLVLAGAGATLFFTGASYYNYPGGVALKKLHQLTSNEFYYLNVDQNGNNEKDGPSRPAHVHIGVKAAMTGVSRYGYQVGNGRLYSKDESLVNAGEYSSFTHLLTDDPTFHQERFEVIENVESFSGGMRSVANRLKRFEWPFETKESVWVMERKK